MSGHGGTAGSGGTSAAGNLERAAGRARLGAPELPRATTARFASRRISRGMRMGESMVTGVAPGSSVNNWSRAVSLTRVAESRQPTAANSHPTWSSARGCSHQRAASELQPEYDMVASQT